MDNLIKFVVVSEPMINGKKLYADIIPAYNKSDVVMEFYNKYPSRRIVKVFIYE